jgi:hypothetical protein
LRASFTLGGDCSSRNYLPISVRHLGVRVGTILNILSSAGLSMEGDALLLVAESVELANDTAIDVAADDVSAYDGP